MGDEILKTLSKISIMLACIFTIGSADTNITTAPVAKSDPRYQLYDDLFNSINKKRYGLSNNKIDKTKDPFIVNSKADTESQSDENTTGNVAPTYVLQGIMTDMANINGHWYKINDTINGHKLIKINNNSVTLDNAGSELKLEFHKGKENVIITTN